MLRVRQEVVSIGPCGARVPIVHVELPAEPSAWCEACRCCALKRKSSSPRSPAEDAPEVLKLTTRRPKWSKKLKAPTLDYGGRCREASVRNFQLTSDPGGQCSLDEISFMLGKLDAELFFVEFKDCLSAVQAFALALTTASLS